jgi:hypothetical protein
VDIIDLRYLPVGPMAYVKVPGSCRSFFAVVAGRFPAYQLPALRRLPTIPRHGETELLLEKTPLRAVRR